MTPLSPSIGALMTLVYLALLGVFAVAYLVLALRAGKECRSFLEAWTGENGLVVLRCRPLWLIPRREASSQTSCLYWLTAVDRHGQLRSGWAYVDGKFWQGDFTPKQVDVQWVRVRAIRRPVARSSYDRSETAPLWDRWIDGHV